MLPYYLFFLYLVSLISSCVYVIRRGGRYERYGAAIMITGSVMTPIIGYIGTKLLSHAAGVLIVDLAVLAAFMTLALRSDKYWPLWTAAFQIIGVATHIAKYVDPAIIPRAYWMALGFWAYPMLVAMVIGVKEERLVARFNAGRY